MTEVMLTAGSFNGLVTNIDNVTGLVARPPRGLVAAGQNWNGPARWPRPDSARGRGVDQLLVDELVDPGRAELPPDTRSLGPAEGQVGHRPLGAVDPDHARVEQVRALFRPGLVGAVDHAAEAERARVGQLH